MNQVPVTPARRPENVEPAGRERLVAVDVARGAAVVVMVCVHTLWMYGDARAQDVSWLGNAIHFVGKGASFFLLTMGLSFMVSRRSGVAASLQRGWWLLKMGWTMNFFKFVLPYLFGVLPDSFLAAYGWTAPLTGGQLLYLLLTGDIPQLAGVSVVLMALLKRVVAHRSLYLWLTALVAVASHPLRGLRVGVPGVDGLLDLLWGAGWNVYFPVFPWIMSCLVGMYLGRVWLDADRDPRPLYRHALGLGVVMLAVGGGLVLSDPATHLGDTFHMGAGGGTVVAGFAAVGLWLAHQWSRLAMPGWLRGLLAFASARVTTLYVWQWVLVCWGMGLVGYRTLSMGQVVALMPVTLTATLGGRWLWERLQGAFVVGRRQQA